MGVNTKYKNNKMYSLCSPYANNGSGKDNEGLFFNTYEIAIFQTKERAFNSLYELINRKSCKEHDLRAIHFEFVEV